MPRAVSAAASAENADAAPNSQPKRSNDLRAHRTLIVSLILAVVLAATASAAPKRLLIDGSTSMLPLVKKLAQAYHKDFPKIPEPGVTGGESDIGVNDVNAGRVDIGDVSREHEAQDPTGLFGYKIARDGICVITNNANPLPNLSQETLSEIFTGTIRDWSEVPGAKVSGPIDLFDRESTSGTQAAFQNIFLGEERKITPDATAESSTGLEVNAIAAEKSAIGFVSLAATIGGGVHPVDYQGIQCTLPNAKSGQYGGVRNFWMLTKGPKKGEAAKFIDWIQSDNKTVHAIIASEWIPLG
jgi:phosphate transport system substrate-binding protein